jgi:hypothetical protein
VLLHRAEGGQGHRRCTQLSPAALAHHGDLSRRAKEHATALGIYAAITAGGTTLGLILGGVLTSTHPGAGCSSSNLPIAAVAVFGALRACRTARRGAGASTSPAPCSSPGGLMAAVYGLVKEQRLQLGLRAHDPACSRWPSIPARRRSSSIAATGAFPALVPFRVFRTRSVRAAPTSAPAGQRQHLR